MRSAIDTSFILCLSANFLSSGRRAIVPSSFSISTITPAGSNPASLAKSIAASVCPFRLSTPPAFALRGKICPGLPRTSGFVAGSINALIVFDRSLAEMPVVHPSPIRSTETVNGVS